MKHVRPIDVGWEEDEYLYRCGMDRFCIMDTYFDYNGKKYVRIKLSSGMVECHSLQAMKWWAIIPAVDWELF